MRENDELAIMLQCEATTITALVDEIEYGEHDAADFLAALRQVGYRLREEAKRLANA